MTPFRWIVVGGLVGLLTVSVTSIIGAVPIEGWQGALLTALSASLFGWLGPQIPVPSNLGGPPAVST
jgi:hypothetical protein